MDKTQIRDMWALMQLLETSLEALSESIERLPGAMLDEAIRVASPKPGDVVLLRLRDGPPVTDRQMAALYTSVGMWTEATGAHFVVLPSWVESAEVTTSLLTGKPGEG